ncbi:MAG: hypothetical protein QOF63_4164 [Thermoanaerobaculia bacterium]|jgi:hypothetical protein|nr:hypothetical protein [Thermoanaerobaculia bacterium]
MAKVRKKSRKTRRVKPRDPLANIPDKATVVATDTLTMPDGARYTILKTDQTDPYDTPPKRRSRRDR